MRGSDLCQKTENFLNGILAVLGDNPIMGTILGDSSSLFKQVENKLGLSIPGDNWIGEAANKYINQNLAQKLRANIMSDIDKLSGGFVSNQAGYIKNTKSVITPMRDMVRTVKGWCKASEDYAGWFFGAGYAASWAMAIPACALASAVTGGALLYLTIMTMQNVTNLQGLLGRLLEMITTMPRLKDIISDLLPDIKFPPEIKWPPEFNLPDIKWPDIKLPEFNWPDFPNFPGLPDFKFPPDFSNLIPGLPKLPDLFPGLPKLPDLIGNMPGLGDLFNNFNGFLGGLPIWNALPKLPDFLGGLKGLPTLNFADLLSLGNLPTINSLTSTLGQLQQLTSGMGGGSQLLSSLGGGASSMSSMAGGAGGAGGGSPTLVSAVKKDDEEEGASGGSGERAPVTATGGSSGGTEGRVL